MAAQLTGTNAPANSSLPVPLSPRSSTDSADGAAARDCSTTPAVAAS